MPNMCFEEKRDARPGTPDVRNKNFLEVALGYTEEQALDEAAALPALQEQALCGRMSRWASTSPTLSPRWQRGILREPIRSSHNPAPCPPCAAGSAPRRPSASSKCVRGIKGEPVGIGRLERFVADWHNKNVCEAPRKPAPNGHKVAVIGSGPSGLTCAGDLAQERLRRHRVRGAAHCGRRAGVRHPGVPAAQRHRAEGNRRPESPGREGARPTWSSAGCSPLTSCWSRAMRRCSSAPARGCPGS